MIYTERFLRWEDESLMKRLIKTISKIKNTYLVSARRDTCLFAFVFEKHNDCVIKLFILSSFRIIDSKGLVLGSEECFEPRDDMKYESFDWQKPCHSQYDKRINEYINADKPIFVKDFRVTSYGDLSLLFSNDNIMEIMIDTIEDQICWSIEINSGYKKTSLSMSGNKYSIEKPSHDN